MKKKLFYGWVIVFATVLLSLMGGGMTSALSVFVLPLMKAHKFTQTQVSGIFSMISFGMLVGSMTLGKLVSKSDIRKLVLIFGLLQGAGLITLGVINQITFIYAVTFIIGYLNVVIYVLSVPILITNWFKAKKGTALGIAAAGIGLGSVLFAPIFSMVIEKSGYKTAFIAYGVITLFLSLLCGTIIRTTPEEKQLKPYGLNEGDPQDNNLDVKNTQETPIGMTLKEAIKTPVYWIFAIFIICATLTQISVFVQTNSYFRTLGYAGAKYSLIISVFGIFSMLGKIVVGYILDKFGLLKGGLLAFVMGILAVGGLIVLKNTPNAIYLYIVFAGGGVMLSFISAPMLVVKLFGLKHYTSVYTSVAVISTISSIAGSVVSGVIIDKLGYSAMYIFALACFGVSLVAYIVINKTRTSKKIEIPPKKVTE